MFLSIVIPTFNRAALIRATIESILDQNVVGVEIIIVDDGSEDNTEAVVRPLVGSNLSYFKIPNGERGAARNYGLKQAAGMYVNYFDSDDIFLPCLQSFVTFAERNNLPPVIYGEILHDVAVTTQASSQSFTKNLMNNNFLACGSVFIKHEVAKEFNFREDRRLSSAEDWELWLRIHASYDFLFFPEKVFMQVHHSNRSLALARAGQIEERDNYFADLMSTDQAMRRRYGQSSINLFIADRYTFIALSYCKSSRIKAYRYWVKSFRMSGRVITRKRFWAVLKKIVFPN